MFFVAFSLAILSVLNLFEFQVLTLWQLSVLTREYGHLGILSCAFVAVWTWRRRFKISRADRRWIFALSLFAAGAFARPIFLAVAGQGQMLQELKVFKTDPLNPSKILVSEPEAQLFSFTDLLGQPLRETTQYRRFDYQAMDGSPLHLDFYSADFKVGDKARPIIVIVHGGGWEAGDTQQLASLNHDLVEAGYAVASVSYRFSPQTRWPGQADDIQRGIEVLLSRAGELGIDPNSWALLGRSAGAQIAGIIAFSKTSLPVKAYINFYGPTDLKFGFDVARDGDILESRGLLKRFLGGEPAEAPENYLSSSVMEAARIRPVPTLLLFGHEDLLVWYKHGERLKRQLRSQGVPVALINLPWGVHGFDFNPAGPGGQISRNAILSFLKSVM